MLRKVPPDSGPGIAPDQRDEALRPFSRLDSARDPNRGGGVGLGLSIAQQLASENSARLEVSSVPDVKTTFALICSVASFF